MIKQMREHLQNMTKRCRDVDGCRYKIGEERCIFGAIIPDDRIDYYSGVSVNAYSVIQNELELGHTWCKDLDPYLMNNLQFVHDTGRWDTRMERFDRCIANYKGGLI